MARIAGVDIPKQKRGIIALTYIFGIGKSRAKDILAKAQVSEDKKVQDWNDDEIGAIRDAVSYFKIEGELRSEIQLNINRLMDIGCQLKTILELEKVREKLLLTRKKQLNNT
jgi:small subunit ribosomal protein S13